MTEELISALVSAAGTVITALLGMLSAYVVKLIKSKISDARTARVLKTAAECVILSVQSTAQTYVDELKKNGNFDKDAQKAAFEKAKNAALAMLSDGVKKTLEELFGDAEQYVSAQIESTVRSMKTPA